MFKNVLVTGLFLTMSTGAMAAQYGMAGCGLGAVVFKDQPGKIQIVAATLNNVISPQTSAITSGTSNCYEGGESSEVAAELYIEGNHQALEKDIARGNGETLGGLLTLMKCDSTDSTQNVLKSKYNYIYQDQNNLSQVKNRLNETLKTQTTCNVKG